MLSLGCQHAQVSMLQEALKELQIETVKPVYYFEQQHYESESIMLNEVVETTYEGLKIANKNIRKPAPLSKLIIGLECGGV